MDQHLSVEHQMFWDRFLKRIEDRVNVQSYNTWFKPLGIESLSESTLLVSVPRPYFSSWLDEHYLPLMTSSAEALLGRTVSISFVVKEDEDGDAPAASIESHDEQPSGTPRVHLEPPSFFKQQVVNPRFTFDSFVVGNSNQFAHAAAKAVAESPGTTAFNPLVIYSGVGLGKTHLLQAIAHHCLKSGQFDTDANPFIYVSSEKFTMDFIMSLQNNVTPQYTTFYRSTSLLLVDDIQFFNNKERTQEEFFHIFNALHQAGKQIVLTMDRPPSQLKGLADRLINRFQWGLVTDIQPPDFETRVAILKKKADNDGVYLDNAISEFIAKHITSNIRELEGSLIRLLAYSSLRGQDISLDMAAHVLGDSLQSQPSIITIESIQKLTAGHFSIPENDIISNSRRKEVAVARHIAIYLCKQLTNSSLKTIGLHFGGRDHSTVIHSIRTVETKYLKDPSLAAQVRQLKEKAKHTL